MCRYRYSGRRRLQHQGGHLTPVHRQPLDLAFTHVGADLRRAGVEKLRRGHNGDVFLDATGLDLKVEAQLLPDCEADAGVLERSETGLLDLDRIGRGLEPGDEEESLWVGLSRACLAGFLVGQRDLGAAHECARRVGHGAGDSCTVDLRPCRNRQGDHGKRHSRHLSHAAHQTSLFVRTRGVGRITCPRLLTSYRVVRTRCDAGNAAEPFTSNSRTDGCARWPSIRRTVDWQVRA